MAPLKWRLDGARTRARRRGMRLPTAAAPSVLALVVLSTLFLSGCAIRVPRSVTVTVPGPAGRLEGALFLPDGPGPYPGVVLIHGAHHDSRLDYVQDARYFASRGVAVLTYDKRGTGGSEGTLEETGFDLLADDAAAAARFLRTRPEIDPARVGLWGMGEGGWIAPLAAARDSAVAFIVVVSAPVVSPVEQLTYQRTEQLVASGVKRPDAEAVARLRGRIWAYWMAPAGTGSSFSDSLRSAFDAARKRPWFARAVEARDLPEMLIPDEAMGAVNHPARRWLAKDLPALWSLRYDPVVVLERVRVPILALYGEKDRDVPIAESIARFRAAMRRGGNKRGAAYSFPAADHSLNVRSGPGLFARTGPAPGYRDTVMAWLARVAGAGSGVAVAPPRAPTGRPPFLKR